MTASSVSLVAVALAFIVAQQGFTEASLMGRGIYRKAHHNKVKPWDVPRKNYYYKYDLHDGAEDNDSWRDESDDGVDEDGNKPCVGLCYLNRLQAAEEEDGDEGGARQPEVVEEIVFNPLTTQRPCVGLCHYYKSLGMDNPYEKRDQAKFTP